MSLELIEALKQEALAEAWVRRMRAEAPGRGVLEPATVVVQNAGLGRWLRLWHARQSGISAAIDMPFARSFIAGVLEGAGLFDRAGMLDGEALTWRIFDLLSDRVFADWGKAGAPLAAYLDPVHPSMEQRCWQLARQVADLFDQYAIYRPEWLRSWQGAVGEVPGAPHWGWQARLFQAVQGALGLDEGEMERRIFGLALHAFCEGRGESERVESPVHVFGISSFSPAFLRFFKRLGEARPVTVYHLVCSEAFLGDLPKNYREALLAQPAAPEDAAEAAMMLDNPVLAASGQAAARFQSLLLALDYGIGDQPSLGGNDAESDLQALQESLRQNRGTAAFRADGTVAVHACHSRKREVQVLQQQLLACFAADPELRPEEIMVLAPEIGDYVDAVEAVFGEGTRTGGSSQPTRIPYCIADQRRSVDENCWRFLLSLLELLKGRQAFSQVTGLIDFDPVCDRLQVSRDELQDLLEVLQAVGVRWGVDAETRAAQGHPPFDAYSWERGLMRLYDGLILSPATATGCAPHPVSSRMAEIVGNFTQLLRPVFRSVRKRGMHQPFEGWAKDLLHVVRSLLSEVGDGALWMRTIALSIGRIREVATDAPIAFETFCRIVEDSREEPSGPTGLLRRGVTFCRLQPVRHIPAKVICILGLNEGEYPRQERAAEFDLIELQRRQAPQLKGGPLALDEIRFLGDHQLREEDRQLFLDCVLNARQRLYLSYVGQSDKSNEPVPPSLLVSELLQFLERSPERGPRKAAVEKVHVRHPLQDWSRQNHLAPQPAEGEPAVPIHFEMPLDEPGSESVQPFLADAEPSRRDGNEDELPLQAEPTDLVRFLTDPAHHYLKRRLQVDLEQLKWSELPEDADPLELDGLGASHLRMRTLDEWMQARASRRHFCSHRFREQLEAGQVLPPGRAGEAAWEQTVEPVLRCLSQQLGDTEVEVNTIDRQFGEWRVMTGQRRLADGRSLIILRGALESNYLLEAYLRHFLGGRESLIICLKDQSCYVAEVVPELSGSDGDPGAGEWLEELLRIWSNGHLAPVPFSLEIGLAYVKDRLTAHDDSRKTPAAMLTHAYYAKWHGWEKSRSDSSPAQRLCFGGDSPAAPGSPYRGQFAELAERLLAPVVRWSESIEKK